MPSKTNSRTAAPEQLLTHIPPQALEMERSVLGSLMVDRAGYDLVTEIITPESFYDKKHQLIYEAIRDLAVSDKPFDVLSVKAQLEKKGTF